MRARLFFLGVPFLSLLVASACSSSSDLAPPVTGPDDGGALDATSTPLDAGTTDAPSETGPSLSPLSFTYAPQWDGVVSVDVLGAFGQSADWMTPLVSLTKDSSGKFTGTSPALPVGTYTYLFQVTGDHDAAPAKRDTYARYAVDPTQASWAACPADSPTYSTSVMNPCSQITVPAAAATTMFHVHGVVDQGTAPVAGYLVMVERDEDTSHHEFVNRTTTGADGTYDLLVAAGTYRVQVLHPTYLSMTDAQRTDPGSLAAVRRLISTSITVAADTEVNAPDVSFTTYASMTPSGTATIPTTFTFAVPVGAKTHAEIYGPGNSIGDPWWNAPLGTDGSDVFDGTFNTPKADPGGLDHAKTYAWGVESDYPKPKNGTVSWTAQSMVFPIAWP